MIRAVIILAMIASLSSCKTYMVSTVASKNTIKSPETGEFNMANDSLAFSYSFAGPNMPLKVEVHNKLKEPLFIDWERSALVIGDKTYSFVDDKIGLNADVKSTVYNDPGAGINFAYSDMQGSAHISKTQAFIPPGAKITRSIYALNNIKEIKLSKSEFLKASMARASFEGMTQVSNASFNEENSPVQFKSYITVFTMKDNIPQSTYYQHDFYVSEMTKTRINPSKILLFKNQMDANIVNENTTGFAKALIVVGVAGAAVAAANINDQNTEN